MQKKKKKKKKKQKDTQCHHETFLLENLEGITA